MRIVLVLVLVAACKGGTSQPPPQPRESALQPLPPGPTATIDPADTQVAFPREPPAIVVWQGGGEPPETLVSVRIWEDGTVRFACNRRGSLPAARVAAMLDTLERAGWLAAGSGAHDSETDMHCITTSVQVARGGVFGRRDMSCGQASDVISDAVSFVLAAVGPDPCAR